MPTPNAIQAAQRFRQQLLNREAEAAERMAIIYSRIFTNLQDQVQALADEIAVMEKPDREEVIKLARMQRILRQVREQVTRFGGTVQEEITVIRSQAIRQGLDDAIRLMTLSLPPLSDDAARAITAAFERLPVDAIELAAGLFSDDSALTEALETAYGEFVAGQVEEHIVDGIAVGQNPRRIAQLLNRNLQSSLGSGLTSALTTIRTAQIKSYQLANHAQYQANPEVVPTWTWVAALDSRTCMSCVRRHGSEFPITETLRDHHNGRCAPVPKTVSYRDLGINLPDPSPQFETGEQWFNRQPQAVQRDMMGGAMFRAWEAGEFAFEDLSQEYNDPVYGEMFREASLKSLIGTKRARVLTKALKKKVRQIVEPGKFNSLDDAREWVRAQSNLEWDLLGVKDQRSANKVLAEIDRVTKKHPNITFDFNAAHVDAVMPSIRQFDRLADEWPDVAKRLEYVGTYEGSNPLRGSFESQRNAMAHASVDGKRIGLNPKWFKSPDGFLDVLAQGGKRGWTVGSSIESVMTHEFGHQVDHWLQRERSSFVDVIGLDGFGLVGDTLNIFRNRNKPRKSLSNYSLTNNAEAFAEAFTALHHRPKKSWPIYVKRFSDLLDMITDQSKWQQKPITELTFLSDLPIDQRAEVNERLNKLRRKINILR